MKEALLILGASVGLVGCTTALNSDSNSQSPAPTQSPAVMDSMDSDQDSGTSQAPTQSIVDIAVSNPNFSTLVTALTEAGLVDTLAGPGPFTVFAPTDAAFDKLPDGTLEAVLADTDQLTSILTYHVVSGKVTSDQVVNLDSATTLEGSQVTIKAENNMVMINDAQVVQTDIEASNGVIHVIDTVLLP